jgi:hypothetical protein
MDHARNMLEARLLECMLRWARLYDKAHDSLETGQALQEAQDWALALRYFQEEAHGKSSGNFR